MIELEKQLRERTGVDKLLEAKINGLDEGHEVMAEIDKQNKELFVEMREKDLNNEQFEAYNNVRYDLKTARHNMHVRMAQFVRIKRKRK